MVDLVEHVLVDAHDDGDVDGLGGCRDDDLAGAGGDVGGGVLLALEAAGALEDEVDAQLAQGSLAASFSEMTLSSRPSISMAPSLARTVPL